MGQLVEGLGKVLFGQDYVDENDRLKIALTTAGLTIVPLILTVVFLAASFFTLPDAMKIEQTFPGVAWADGRKAVTGMQSSNAFSYELRLRYVAQELGNFTSDEIDIKIAKVIDIMWPADYARYETAITKYEDSVKKNLIDLSFTPTENPEIELVSDGAFAEASWKGVGRVTIAKEKQPPVSCTFKVNMMTKGGDIYVNSYAHDCF